MLSREVVGQLPGVAGTLRRQEFNRGIRQSKFKLAVQRVGIAGRVAGAVGIEDNGNVRIAAHGIIIPSKVSRRRNITPDMWFF
jgi:hypothetical protein